MIALSYRKSSMKRFNPDNFYSKELNHHCSESINLKKPGIELLAQYLHFKYGSNITWSPCFLICTEEINQLALQEQASYRHAFIVHNTIGQTESSVFVAYIKENNQKAIIYSDAKGSDRVLAKKLADTTELQVYASQKIRLSTAYLSHIDALVFARDITRINLETGNYYMPNLIEKLESRSFLFEGYKDFCMPNKLLKTSVFNELVLDEFDRNDASLTIHKHETLAAFRARFSYGDEPTYLHEKGIKYADIINIQFYLNEVEQALGRNVSLVVKNKFINGAKNTLALSKHLHDFSENFLRLMSQPGIKNIPTELLSNSIFYKTRSKQATVATLASCTLS